MEEREKKFLGLSDTIYKGLLTFTATEFGREGERNERAELRE